MCVQQTSRCDRWEQTGHESDMNEAWDLYLRVYSVIKNESKDKANQSDLLEFRYVSPLLERATDLELAVPGTETVKDNVVTIASFLPQLQIFASKQRPRRFKILGTDGTHYSFLLKGHEDLRLDQRVMQLFGLVNAMLANDPHTRRMDLHVRGYAVIPLEQEVGVIGWLEGCDTLFGLIKEYRAARHVLLQVERMVVGVFCPHHKDSHASLSIIQKVEVFMDVIKRTSAADIERVLWLRAHSTEKWLDQRTNYTRSLAVMSMVGYVLGLGDRHPSNIMLDRKTGKAVHIDFGDCFEVAMTRTKLPEQVCIL